MSDYNNLINVINALKSKNHAEKQKVVASINIIMSDGITKADIFSLVDEQIEKMAILNGKEKVLNELLESITQEQ